VRREAGAAAPSRPFISKSAALPVITGENGSDAIFKGAADFDLELIERRTLDGDIQELTYQPRLHVHG
jgi:hypothetical protein